MEKPSSDVPREVMPEVSNFPHPVRREDVMSSAASAAETCELFILTVFLSMMVYFVHETFGRGVVIQLSEQDFIG